jgi:pyruvate dehydrogenase E1 component
MQPVEDSDPFETREWLDSLASIVRCAGRERGVHILNALGTHARRLGLKTELLPSSAYRNTIPLSDQTPHPGDVLLEERLTALMRWNALAMVVRANRAYGELGGHIASYASPAEIFETGFNHFFKCRLRGSTLASRTADSDSGQDQEGLWNGPTGESRMTCHQEKKLEAEALR